MFAKWFGYRVIGLYDRWTIKKRPDKVPLGVSSILMAELTRIGDVLVATPVVEAVRKKYPSAEITMVVQEGCWEILQHNPHVDQVIRLQNGASLGTFLIMLMKIRRHKPDLAVSLSPSIKNAIVAHLCGARYKGGYLNDKSTTPTFLNHHLIEARGFAYGKAPYYKKKEHLTLRAAKAVLPLDVGPVGRKLAFFLSPDASFKGRKILKPDHLSIVVHPTSGWHYKSWPKEDFVRLVRMIRAYYGDGSIQIILMGSKQDSETLAYIDRALDHSLTVILGRPLSVVGHIIKEADLFVGNDSAPLHIAEAFGIPFVGLFGPSLPETTGPLSEGAFIREDVECTPCAQTVCKRVSKGETACMALIQPGRVFEAVKRIVRVL